MVATRKRYRPLYKKFIRLKVNPLNNKRIFKFKREKWKPFLDSLKRADRFYTKYKPYAHSNHIASKFASPGNSYKRRFRNNLIAQKVFNYFYGGLSRKYMKTRMAKIYKSREFRDPILTCVEFFESRLDSVLYRAKFSCSIKQARQLIAHKHIKVNNQTEKNKSYMLKQGDLIQVRPESIGLVQESLKKQLIDSNNKIWPTPPTYLTINYNTLEIVVGDLKNYNFSTSFPYRLDVDSIITNYYRH